MKASPIVFFVLVLLSVQHTESQTQISIQLTHGYNVYAPFEHYYSNYERVSISDLENNQNGREFHFCFVNQVQKPKLQIVAISKIMNSSKDQEDHVIYDLKQFIQINKIIASLYSYSKQSVYILLSNQIQIHKIQTNGNIGKVQGLKLESAVDKGEFTQVQDKVMFSTLKKVYFIVNQGQRIKLEQTGPVGNQDKTLTSVMNIGGKLYVSSTEYLSVYEGQSSNSINLKIISVRNIVGFQIQSPSLSQHEVNLIFASDEKGIIMSLDVNLDLNQALSLSKFYRLSHTKMCTHVNKWFNYLFFQCDNHLLYANSNQLIRCLGQNNKMFKCLNDVKMTHVNIGYHIQSVQFAGNQTMVLAGIDQFEILDISVSVHPQVKHAYQILSIKHSSAYRTNEKIEKVYLAQVNQTVILTQNKLLLGRNVQQRNQIFCKTVDQSNHQDLGHSSGTYSGTVRVEGMCGSNKYNYQQKQVQGSNICQTEIPIRVKINSQTNYQFIWYVLLGLIGLAITINVVYFCWKKRQLSSQYKMFEDQKQYGQEVMQQTMVTEPNQQSSIQK